MNASCAATGAALIPSRKNPAKKQVPAIPVEKLSHARSWDILEKIRERRAVMVSRKRALDEVSSLLGKFSRGEESDGVESVVFDSIERERDKQGTPISKRGAENE
jgi:hypothetical protein